MKNDGVEVELVNGHRTVIPKEWDKLYNIEEKTRTSFKLTKQFPFVKCVKQTYVSFRFRTEFVYANSWFDPKYKVRCSLAQLAKLFDANVTSFDKTIVESDLQI